MRTRGHPVLLVLCLVALHWSITPADARTVLSQGPEISNGVVTWLTNDLRRERYAVHVKHPGRRPVVVATGGVGGMSSGPNWFRSSIRFYASSTHLALERVTLGSDEFEGDNSLVALRAGAFGADPLPRIARCYTDGDARSHRVALADALLAYEATPCGSTSTLAVRDLSADSEWQLRQPAERHIGGLSAAGRHVAISRTDGVTIINADSRQVEYELQLPPSRRLDDVEVSRDGSLAALTNRTPERCDGRMDRYAANGEPIASLTRACELVAALPGGTVFVTGRRRSRSIVYARLGEPQPQPIVRLGRCQLTGADADRNKLAWATPHCSGSPAIHVTRLSQPTMTRGW